ncbi:hypothetical protein Slin15195_G099980 [Septoria linicola]|uniref:Uncharacterized protein n=1 Tax=Septoria linicola TaxID=215465 RepID=A0A9Q9AX69_9PEZI|nr:hypothetical protein Slin15195_G099980 [Septoria linicola]
MCTQALIWCSCGHGEFLPIHGLNERCPLPPVKPLPGSPLAAKIEANQNGVLESLLRDPSSWPDDGEEVIASLDVDYGELFEEAVGDGTVPDEMEDVLSGGFMESELGPDLQMRCL